MVRTKAPPTEVGVKTLESPLAGSAAAPPSPRRPMLATMLAVLVVLLLAGMGGALIWALGDSEPASDAPAGSDYTGDWKDTYQPTRSEYTGDWKDSYEPRSGTHVDR